MLPNVFVHLFVQFSGGARTRTLETLARLQLIVAAAAVFAGCGGPQPPIATRPNFVQNRSQSREIATQSLAPAYKTTGPLLYVASYDMGLTPVRIYKPTAKDPKLIAQISKDIASASGACIDGDGTLYVTNQSSGPGWVSEYALGHRNPRRVITKGINTPAYCAIDASGNLWVTNIGLDDVAEYLKGSTEPHATITQGLTYPDGIAIDHLGNVYVGNPEPFSAPDIQVYAPGSGSPSRTITEGVTWPDGLAVDSHDTLYVANFYGGMSGQVGYVAEYRSGQGKPYRTITDEVVHPADVAVNKKGRLYVANWPESASSPYLILEFPPHSLKPSSKEIINGIFNPQGLAYYPPVLP